MRRTTLLPLLVAGAAVALPPAVHAGTIAVPDPDAQPPMALFEARHGEVNDLEIRRSSGTTIVVGDAGAPLNGGAGCTPMDALFSCFPVFGVNADLGNRDDRADVVVTGPGEVWAGSGDDVVHVDSFSDPLKVYGGPGRDNLTAGGQGGQLADGGPGNDVVRVGGSEGEATGIGGPGRDVIVFSVFFRGNGILDGGVGDDRITLQPGASSIVTGGPGRDVVGVRGERPQINTGGYSIDGGVGDDVLSGGPDADTIDGGRGDDSIDVTADGVDRVTCGDGDDIVTADAADFLEADCETTWVTAG